MAEVLPPNKRTAVLQSGETNPAVRNCSRALFGQVISNGKDEQHAARVDAETGSPSTLDNLVRRVIVPALSRCTVCRKLEDKHKPEGHVYQRDQLLPQWHGWHAFGQVRVWVCKASAELRRSLHQAAAKFGDSIQRRSFASA
jgi:hypothetical protein